MNKKITSLLIAVFVLVLSFNSAFAAATRDNTKPAEIKPPKNEPVTDLVKAYEIWKNKGIKLVVRDKEGKFTTWSVGRLECRRSPEESAYILHGQTFSSCCQDI